MGAMTVVKNDNTLVKINNGILAIGGALSEETLIEIYNRDFDFWTPMLQWTRPFNSISGHFAVGISDHTYFRIQLQKWPHSTSLS